MTLAQERSTTERIWATLPFILIAAVSLAGAFYRPAAQAVTGGPVNTGDVAWMLTATGLVLLMTPGLSFFYGGMVRTKNVVSTMLQSFVAMAVISILWIVVGFSLAFGDSVHGLIGNPLTFFMFTRVGAQTHPNLAPTIPLVLFALFQLKFAIITPALITGSFAERVRFTSYLLFMCLFSVFIYSPLAHWTWHPDGFLHKLGVLDFAGGTVVHMSAGFAALAGALTSAGAKCTAWANCIHRRTSRSSSWGRACSGSGGSGSTPGRPCRHPARPRWRSRLRIPHRPPRRWRGFFSTACAETSRPRLAPASAPSSAWWRSHRRPVTSASARAS